MQERVGERLCQYMEIVVFALGVSTFHLLSTSYFSTAVFALHAASAEHFAANLTAAADVHAGGAAASPASGFSRVCGTKACGARVQVENVCQADHANQAP